MPSPTPLQPLRPKNFWMLDPAVTFLNHGSFGSCPRPVLDFQNSIRDRLESDPVTFFVKDLEPLLDQAREALARFVGADHHDLVFVPNATSGINTVLRSLSFNSSDELLVTNHEYNACRNALDFIARRSGAKVVVCHIPFPLHSKTDLLDLLLRCCSPRTKLLLIDHVTSQTGLVLPLEKIIPQFESRGIEVLVDGAHAPGMIPLQLGALGASYYTGNCHKWMCAPKGAAFLFVRAGRQKMIRPLTISHGASSPRADRSRFLIEFGWTGTGDPSPFLSVPEALRVMDNLLPGGWPEIMKRNRHLALAARDILAHSLGIEPPCPDSLLASLVSLPLPDARVVKPSRSPLYLEPLQEKLFAKARIQVPIIPWPAPPKRLLRVSAQVYNFIGQYDLLAQALADLLKRER